MMLHTSRKSLRQKQEVVPELENNQKITFFFFLNVCINVTQ